jgi:hypothetical protein
MSELFRPLVYCTAKLTEEQRKYIAKCYLNAQYGTMTHANTDSIKEIKKMRREYIVVHRSKDGRAGIIFKDAVEAILPYEGYFNTEIIVNGCVTLVTDSYENIVKQMLK